MDPDPGLKKLPVRAPARQPHQPLIGLRARDDDTHPHATLRRPDERPDDPTSGDDYVNPAGWGTFEGHLRKVFIVVVNPSSLYWRVRDRLMGKEVQRL